MGMMIFQHRDLDALLNEISNWLDDSEMKIDEIKFINQSSVVGEQGDIIVTITLWYGF